MKRAPIILAVSLLIVLPLIAFSGIIGHDFVNWDDDHYIFANPHITAFNLKWSWTEVHPTWHPLAWTMHMIDYAIGGLNPHVHHATSVVIHIANGILLFALFLTLADAYEKEARKNSAVVWSGLCAALLWSLHPLRVEAVAWATEKKELLSTLFALPSYIAYVRFAQTKSLRAYLACALFLAAALASKPMAMTAPLVMLLLDVFPLRRLQQLRDVVPRVVEKLPLLALSLATGLITIFAQDQSKALASTELISIGSRIAIAVNGFCFYIEKTFWPADLSPYYPLWPKMSDAPIAVPLCLLIFATGAAIWAFREGQKIWLVIWLAYVVMLVPVNGLVQIGSHAAADRFSYVPSLPLCLGVGALVWKLWSRARIPTLATVTAIALTLIFCTRAYATVWQNAETMWLRVSEMYPRRVVQAENNLGTIYHQRGELDRAAEHYRRAIAIFPNHANAHNNLGLILATRGDLAGARVEFETAIAINPDHAQAHANLAKLGTGSGGLTP